MRPSGMIRMRVDCPDCGARIFELERPGGRSYKPIEGAPPPLWRPTEIADKSTFPEFNELYAQGRRIWEKVRCRRGHVTSLNADRLSARAEAAAAAGIYRITAAPRPQRGVE